MQFCWVTLKVSNLEKSLEFYHGLLGLPIAERFSGGGGAKIVMLGDEDQPKVELIQTGEGEQERPGAGVSVGFQTQSLSQSMKELAEAGVSVKRGPISPGPDIRFFFVDDPDGYEVQLVESR